MDQTQREPTFEESIKQVMQTLPPPIRNYLGQGKYSVVANNLMTKYGLHVDQGGILEREIMLLLMGIENPDEFTQALAGEAKLDQQTINSITQDVNTQIFVPLREEMRKGPQQTAAPTSSASPRTSQGTARAMPVPQRPTAQMTVNEPLHSQPEKHFQLQNKIPPPSAPRPSVAHSVGGSDLRNVLSSITKEVPKPIAGEKLLEDHEEPHIEFHKAQPPTNLPGVIQPSVSAPLKPPTLPITSIPPIPAKPYSSDPYRESTFPSQHLRNTSSGV